MIIKYTRKSRAKNVIEGYIRFPDTYPFKHAIKLLHSYKGINTNKEVKFERVSNTPSDKRLKEIDINTKKVETFFHTSGGTK